MALLELPVPTTLKPGAGVQIDAARLEVECCIATWKDVDPTLGLALAELVRDVDLTLAIAIMQCDERLHRVKHPIEKEAFLGHVSEVKRRSVEADVRFSTQALIIVMMASGRHALGHYCGQSIDERFSQDGETPAHGCPVEKALLVAIASSRFQANVRHCAAKALASMSSYSKHAAWITTLFEHSEGDIALYVGATLLVEWAADDDALDVLFSRFKEVPLAYSVAASRRVGIPAAHAAALRELIDGGDEAFDSGDWYCDPPFDQAAHVLARLGDEKATWIVSEIKRRACALRVRE